MSSIRDSTSLQSRAFCESKYPRGTYNIMADGNSLVEQYSKRAKTAEDEILSLKRKLRRFKTSWGLGKVKALMSRN